MIVCIICKIIINSASNRLNFELYPSTFSKKNHLISNLPKKLVLI